MIGLKGLTISRLPYNNILLGGCEIVNPKDRGHHLPIAF